MCHTVPQKVQETAMFVIDLQDVDERDLTADGNGIYKRQSSPTELVTAEVESSRIRSVKKLAKKKWCGGTSTFEIKRYYSWHSLSQEFCCTVIKVRKKEAANPTRFAVIQYKVTRMAQSQFYH